MGCCVKFPEGESSPDKAGGCVTGMEVPLRFKNGILKKIAIEEWIVGREATYFRLKPISIPTNKVELLLDAAGQLQMRSGLEENNRFNLLGLNFL